MAFLVPLLLPSVINATANVALGVTNAIQGTSSSFTFQIGNQVFTTNKPFPFGKLPREVREQIIIEALDASRDLISTSFGPPMDPMPGMALSAPLRPSKHFTEHNPLDPSSAHYRSIVGEYVSANGHPLSAWRWLGLSREWRRVLRWRLWREVEIGSESGYRRFGKFVKDGFLDDVLGTMRSLKLDQGYEDPSELYAIIRHPKLLNVREIKILSSWPFPTNIYEPPARLFQFGMQLVPAPPAMPLTPTNGDDEEASDEFGQDAEKMRERERLVRERPEDRKRLDVFALGLPLDLATNVVQRKHLAELRPRKLCVTLLEPTVAILTELRDLLADKIDCLSVRYIASIAGDRGLINPNVLISDVLDSFKQVDIHLPALAGSAFRRNYPGQTEMNKWFTNKVMDMITSDGSGERQKRYSVNVIMQDPMLNRAIPILHNRVDVIWEREVEQPEDASAAITVLFDALTTEEEKAAAAEADQFGTDDGESEAPYMNQASPSKAPNSRPPFVNLSEAEQSGQAGPSDPRRSLDSSGPGRDRKDSLTKKDKRKQPEVVHNPDNWERATNLNLFGGLIKLRMESKKH